MEEEPEMSDHTQSTPAAEATLTDPAAAPAEETNDEAPAQATKRVDFSALFPTIATTCW